MKMPKGEQWMIVGFIGLFIFVIVCCGINQVIKSKRERAGDEITIIDKKENESHKLIIFKSKTEDRAFASVYGTSEGWGIFSSLKVGGKYRVSIRRSDDGSKYILKILKVISEPIAVREPYDPYKALERAR